MDVEIEWDADDAVRCNVRHIWNGHRLTQEDVESVLENPQNYGGFSRSSQRPLAFGWTSSGRYICDIYEEISSEPFIIYPVTAYDVSPPGQGHR